MLITILAILVAAIAFVLCTPLVVEIDSDSNLYRIRLRGIISAQAIVSEGQILLLIWVLGWTTTIDPFKRRTKKQAPAIKQKQPRKRRIAVEIILRKMKAVLRSFTVSYLYIDLDTDDYVINAWLYPIAGLLSKRQCRLRINYQGRVCVRCRISNTLARILLAMAA